MVNPDKTYHTILIDPPWAFRTYTEDDAIAQRAPGQHYPTMPLNEIAGLPIPKLAARNCALFMWAVDAHLLQALKLIDIWGFTYRTRAFTWIKPGIGMGYWTRKQTETCLLATYGSPGRYAKDVREVIEAPRREHSRKPDEIYDRIEALVGGPYLEMFARKTRPGWDSWGNETRKFDNEDESYLL